MTDQIFQHIRKSRLGGGKHTRVCRGNMCIFDNCIENFLNKKRDKLRTIFVLLFVSIMVLFVLFLDKGVYNVRIFTLMLNII